MTIRLTLNYKKLPYKTIALEYPDIENESIKVGITARYKWPDGRPMYTSPFIFDNSTNTAIPDSYQIAQYLDKTYPDTPKLFPPGTEALQAAFYARYKEVIDPYFLIFITRVPSILNPRSAEYFIRTRSEEHGEPLANLEPKGQDRVEAWKQVERAYDTLNGWLSKSSGPYFMGDAVTFVDLVTASTLYAMAVVFGEESQEWKDLMTWNNGRWAAFRKSMEQYASMG
jgi:glutathione S-transferase